MRLTAFAALALSVLGITPFLVNGLAAAEGAADPQVASQLKVVTGNTIVQDIVRHIGGDLVTSTCLLQAGVDPHSYQPVPEDVKRLSTAQLVIINGLGFEGWFAGLAKESGFKGTLLIATAGIEPLKMDAEEDGHGNDHGHAHGKVDDPHAFNSIASGVRYAENIRDALIATDSAHADTYRTNSVAYITELRKTDAWAKKEFAALTRAQRKLITNHDALQYFAKEYGFEILAPNTALEDSEPSAKDVAELVTFIRAQQVKGVFLEFGKNDKVIRQISTEAAVTIGNALYLDGVGPADSPANTYVGMFRSNVTNIVNCLK